MSTPKIPAVPTVQLLPAVPNHASLLASKESVASAIISWAKRRIMNKSIGDKELEELLEATRAAGRAEGYAQAKFEMALERAKAAAAAPPTPASSSDDQMGGQEPKTVGGEPYKTRTTVNMTRQIALDYLKSAAPRIVGPSEIKKNSEKKLNVFISFGTLSRAMVSLVESGEVEQIEQSRWRYRGHTELPLRSVR